MTIGLCRLTLFIPDSGSLKHKRHVLKSVTTRVRNKFNVSVSELDSQDLWQKAELGVVMVSNDTRFVNQVLSKVVDLIEQESRVELVDYSLEMI